jgi:hypothetical protein
MFSLIRRGPSSGAASRNAAKSKETMGCPILPPRLRANIGSGVTPHVSSRKKRSLPRMTPSIALPTLYQEALVSFAQGKNEANVLKNLTDQGLPEPHAKALMDEALRTKKAAFRRAGLEMIWKGAWMIACGAAVTAFTYSLHMPIFIVATGPILFGVISLFKGLYRVAVG